MISPLLNRLPLLSSFLAIIYLYLTSIPPSFVIRLSVLFCISVEDFNSFLAYTVNPLRLYLPRLHLSLSPTALLLSDSV